MADFDFSPSGPSVKEKITFDGSKSYDPDGRIMSYRWYYTIANASHLPVSIGSGKVISYSWDREGDYIVILEVRDDVGFSSFCQKKIHVEKVSIPPSADFSYNPPNPRVEETITFDASGSEDDGSITGYFWDFGDGKTGNGKIVKHSYSSPGTYTVILIVVDDDGLKSKAEKDIEIKPRNQKTVPNNHSSDEGNDKDNQEEAGENQESYNEIDNGCINDDSSQRSGNKGSSKGRGYCSRPRGINHDENDTKDGQEDRTCSDIFNQTYGNNTLSNEEKLNSTIRQSFSQLGNDDKYIAAIMLTNAIAVIVLLKRNKRQLRKVPCLEGDGSASREKINYIINGKEEIIEIRTLKCRE